MKYGLFYELEVGDAGYTERDIWHNSLAQIELGEQCGFDSVYAVEHHFNPGYSHSSCPEIFLAAASQRTSVIRMGTGVQLLPIAHPVRVAEQVAALDILTDGRYDFGIGRGTFSPEFTTFGAPHARGESRELNREMFFEALDVILKCWGDEPFTYDGKFYKIPEPINVVPKPVQKPHPPIYAAAGSPDSFTLYPSRGFHIMPQTAVTPLAETAKALPAAYQAWKDAGNDEKIGPLQVNTLVPVHVAPTQKQAEDQMREYEMWYFGKLREFFAPKSEEEAGDRQRVSGGTSYWENPSWEYIRDEKMVICGDPDRCIEVLKEYEEAGINRVMCQMQVGGMPHTMVMQAIKLWGDEVIPNFAS